MEKHSSAIPSSVLNISVDGKRENHTIWSSKFDVSQVGYGENYDYQSIMHYSSRAFVRDYSNKEMRSIRPKDKNVDPDDLGFKANLSDIDKKKIRKMYKCAPYNDYKVGCS